MRLDQQIIKARLLDIDRGSTWVIEDRRLDVPIEELSQEEMPRILICVSLEDELPVGSYVGDPEMPDSEAQKWLLDCMLKPMYGKPRRPRSVTLIGNAARLFQPILAQVGVDTQIDLRPHPLVDKLIAALTAEMTGPSQPPYLDVRGVTADAVEEFFEASQRFYKSKPWKLFEYDLPLGVEILGKKPVKYWAIVMGTLGEELGLSMFRSSTELIAALSMEEDDDAFELIAKTWTLGFSYSDIDDIGILAETELMENRWPIAGKSAYPSAIVHDPKKDTVTSPTKKQLQDLTAATSALVEFFKRHRKSIGHEDVILADVIDVEVAGAPLRVSIDLPAVEFLEVDEDDEEESSYRPGTMSLFIERFPEGLAETRTWSIPAGGALPADDYALLEFYCDDPNCDCKRTLIRVVGRSSGKAALASINYSWEDGPNEPPELDPIAEQSEYADVCLQLFTQMLEQDPSYEKRLKQHYTMFRKPAGRGKK